MGRQVVKSCLPTPIVGWKSDGMDHSHDLFFLGWRPLHFSLEWWGLIRYGVYGSPAVCCWREPVISRILDCNRQPVEHGVLNPDSSPRALR
jgi:hypothetical protein